jgi:5-(hydroxymethyl)furfural/furfural oxidase
VQREDGEVKWVVVGAGSGGCVAARRLCDAGHRVVLIEAGPALEPGGVPPPIDGDDSFAALDVDGRVYENLTARRTARGPETRYLRGRGVGGSSAVNAMVALRGDPARYRSWGWDDVDEAWDRMLIPVERPGEAELGRIDRLLLASDSAAEITPLTRRNGRRVTSAEAYLWPLGSDATDRFEVLTQHTVDRVLLDVEGAATGIVLSNGELVDADAVVLAAGAIHTPAVLQRSGVEGAGTGLRDHPAAGLLLQLADVEATRLDPRTRGLATATLADRGAIQVLSLNHLGPSAPVDTAMLLVALMRPTGDGGKVRIRSSDPAVPPTVEFDLLRYPDDRRRLAQGVADVIEMLRRPPFAEAIEAIYIDDQGTTADSFEGDVDVIADWLSRHGADYVHASSSCAAIIGGDGGVTGHEGLFVCDASAFPDIPDVNTHLPTTMLAERLTARWPGVAGSMA